MNALCDVTKGQFPEIPRGNWASNRTLNTVKITFYNLSKAVVTSNSNGSVASRQVVLIRAPLASCLFRRQDFNMCSLATFCSVPLNFRPYVKVEHVWFKATSEPSEKAGRPDASSSASRVYTDACDLRLQRTIFQKTFYFFPKVGDNDGWLWTRRVSRKSSGGAAPDYLQESGGNKAEGSRIKGKQPACMATTQRKQWGATWHGSWEMEGWPQRGHRTTAA